MVKPNELIKDIKDAAEPALLAAGLAASKCSETPRSDWPHRLREHLILIVHLQGQEVGLQEETDKSHS